MSEESQIQKVLQGILSTQAYDKLHQFADETSWQDLSSDEKDLLAQAFVLAAESKVDESSELPDCFLTVKKSLDAAVALAPMNARVWYRRGLILASHINDLSLQEACLCFEKALSINSSFFDAWYAWANVLMRRGIVTKEPLLLLQAEEKFSQAHSLLDHSPAQQAHLTDFFWHWGLLAFLIGRSSGEAKELYTAIERYTKAKELGFEKKEFLNDFANALVEFAILVNRQSLIFDAIELYLKALDVSDTHEKPHELAIRYFNLGCCYQYLFETHFEEAFFLQAQESYEKSVAISDFLPAVWSNWAYLLFFAFKVWQDPVFLESSVHKWKKVPLQDFEDVTVLSRRIETLATFGEVSENVEMIKEAEVLALQRVQKDPKSAELWYALACCIYELGRYFDEESYFLQAQEKCQQGLQNNPKFDALTYLLALVKLHLGQRKESKELTEEALISFQLASKTEIGRFGYFWNDWGSCLLLMADMFHEKKYAEAAVIKLEQAILIQEYIHPYWLFHYGCALDTLGDFTDDETCYERAIQALSHAASQDPTFVQTKYHLGLAHMHLGEISREVEVFKKAADCFQTVLEEEPEDEEARNDLGVVFLHLAQLITNERAEYLEAAEFHFLQASLLGNVFCYYNLVCLYALQNDAHKALLYLERAFEAESIPPLQDVLADDWLDNIKNTPSFRHFIQKYDFQ